VGGRKADRLVSGPVPGFAKGRGDSCLYLVDSETYYPLLVRYTFGSASIVIRYSVYERLQFGASHRRLLQLDPHPGARELDQNGRPVKP
jgi:hypothetical protein